MKNGIENFNHGVEGKGSSIKDDWLYKDLENPLEAGWFYDGIEEEIDYMLDFLCTPLNKLKIPSYINSLKEPVILITSGSYAPIHSGHIDLMEAAKVRLEKENYEVIGGYFSPSHDNYVLTKDGVDIPATVRCNLIQAAIDDSNWLMLDPWASILVKGDVNFSVIMDRIQKYVKYHRGIDVKICYVFGADRYYFANAFKNDGMAICVTRPGFNNRVNLPNVYYADLVSEASSTAIRNGNHSYIPNSARQIYKDWQLKNNNPVSYLLRDDYAGDEDFILDVMDCLSGNLGPNVDVQIMDSQWQCDRIRFDTEGKKTLSLDPIFKGDQNFETSRLFNIADYQSGSRMYVSRPGSEPIYKQRNIISGGDYVLIEDDSVTGRTIAHAIKELPQCNIIEVKLMSSLYDENYYDVVDLRDFLLGSEHGGLVVELVETRFKHESIRVPYMWPYVNVTTRASIPAENTIKFSKKMWEINLEYYIRNPTKVRNMPNYFISLAMYLNFDLNCDMVDVIKFHLEHFND